MLMPHYLVCMALALGFTLLVLRYIRPHLQFDDTLMKTAFWWMNIGLALMLFTSLLPIESFSSLQVLLKGCGMHALKRYYKVTPW